MKATWRGSIKKIEQTGGVKEWVQVHVDVVGTVIDGGKGVDSKATGADLCFRVKPIIAQDLRFGQELFFTVSTEKPEELLSVDRLRCTIST